MEKLKTKTVYGVKLFFCEPKNAWITEKDCALRHKLANENESAIRIMSFDACRKCKTGKHMSKKHNIIPKYNYNFGMNGSQKTRIRMKYEERARKLGYTNLREALDDMLSDGASIEDVAIAIGMTRDSVTGYLSRFGMSKTEFNKRIAS